MKNLLVIFVKNPIEGMVKTRLASSIGNKKALDIYRELLNRTLAISTEVSADIRIFYHDFIPQADNWPEIYPKHLQKGEDLGERMKNAFQVGFELGYQHICVIGSDCFELNADTINQAFTFLKKSDLVVGPANDGGYYLIGMNRLLSELFHGIDWSTERVLSQTLSKAQEISIKTQLIDEKIDIDTIDDLKQFPELLSIIDFPSEDS